MSEAVPGWIIIADSSMGSDPVYDYQCTNHSAQAIGLTVPENNTLGSPSSPDLKVGASCKMRAEWASALNPEETRSTLRGRDDALEKVEDSIRLFSL